ncbi:MAG TPA: hypothetical protein VGI40_26125 [Pirellulaceae bacterium]
MRYRLRTLLIVLAIGPPVLAFLGWFLYIATYGPPMDDEPPSEFRRPVVEIITDWPRTGSSQCLSPCAS